MNGRYWISLPAMTFAVAARAGTVTEAAPIAKWAIGKDVGYVLDYYRRRGAQVERLEP